MIAEIVPIKKIRSGVETLSYLIPESMQTQIKIGQRVIIPFRSSQIVGLVWQINPLIRADKINRKLKSIVDILDQKEFIDQRGRDLLIWITEYYLAPLPTVLATAIPENYYRLTRRSKPQSMSDNYRQEVQQLILAPYLDYPGIDKLRTRSDFIEYSQSLSDRQQAVVWQKIATGQKVVVFGTYQPIYLPFKNLKQIIIFEPENDLYKYEQNPKVHVAVVAQKLAKIHQAKLVIKSYSPSLPSLSQPSQPSSPSTFSYQIADISSEKRLINFQTESWLESRLKQNRRIIIFYNVYDVKDNQSRFGIKSLKADLEKKFPQTKITVIDRDIDLRQNLDDCQIIIGTAKILYLPKILEGDLLIPTVDPFLDRPDFQPDKILAQINKLGRFSQSILIQTKKLDHPFMRALALSFPPSEQPSKRESNLDNNLPIIQYLSDFKQKKQKLGQFPYGFWIRLIYSDRSESVCQQETEKIIRDLKSQFPGQIEIFGPSPAIDRSVKKKYRYSVLIKVSDDHMGSSLPDSRHSYVIRGIRIALLKLKKPWSLDPHPVNLV